jgi:hypothetical protein
MQANNTTASQFQTLDIPQHNTKTFKFTLNADIDSAFPFFGLVSLHGKLLSIWMPARCLLFRKHEMWQ